MYYKLKLNSCFQRYQRKRRIITEKNHYYLYNDIITIITSKKEHGKRKFKDSEGKSETSIKRKAMSEIRCKRM